MSVDSFRINRLIHESQFAVSLYILEARLLVGLLHVYQGYTSIYTVFIAYLFIKELQGLLQVNPKFVRFFFFVCKCYQNIRELNCKLQSLDPQLPAIISKMNTFNIRNVAYNLHFKAEISAAFYRPKRVILFGF